MNDKKQSHMTAEEIKAAWASGKLSEREYEVMLEKAESDLSKSMLPMEYKITLFYGKTNPEFSNFYIAPFVINNVEYPSVEHYFMMAKAKMFDPDGEAMQKMNNELTPSQMKKLGRQVKNFNTDGWNIHSKTAMYQAVYAKFSQNPVLKEKLLNTEYSLIAEASPFDKKWGIGIGISHKNAYNPSEWKCSNWLGLILMAVRGELRYGKFDPEKATYYMDGDTYPHYSVSRHAPCFFEDGSLDWDDWIPDSVVDITLDRQTVYDIVSQIPGYEVYT